jgi:acylaminoacyl-peptidase
MTKFPLDIQAYKLYKRADNEICLLLVFEVYPNKTIDETVDIDERNKRDHSSGVVYDRLMMRHWDKWNCYAKRNHLFVATVSILPSGLLACVDPNPIDLMYGFETDCPGNNIAITILPDIYNRIGLISHHLVLCHAVVCRENAGNGVRRVFHFSER